jgi:hypothetical protein
VSADATNKILKAKKALSQSQAGGGKGKPQFAQKRNQQQDFRPPPNRRNNNNNSNNWNKFNSKKSFKKPFPKGGPKR